MIVIVEGNKVFRKSSGFSKQIFAFRGMPRALPHNVKSGASVGGGRRAKANANEGFPGLAFIQSAHGRHTTRSLGTFE
jgi:hypothetical protein